MIIRLANRSKATNPYPAVPTKAEFKALAARVAELETRLGSVSRMSNAEKQRAYRERKKHGEANQ